MSCSTDAWNLRLAFMPSAAKKPLSIATMIGAENGAGRGTLIVIWVAIRASFARTAGRHAGCCTDGPKYRSDQAGSQRPEGSERSNVRPIVSGGLYCQPRR